MDGIFTAYHNTQKMFGFEYISLKDMEENLFSSQQKADILFSFSMQIMNRILNEITAMYPEQDTKVFIAAPRAHVRFFNSPFSNLYLDDALVYRGNEAKTWTITNTFNCKYRIIHQRKKRKQT